MKVTLSAELEKEGFVAIENADGTWTIKNVNEPKRPVIAELNVSHKEKS
jgi:hypothetical protein